MCLSRSGAGSTPYSRRMLAIVLRPTSCHRLAIAPWIRVYPHRSILKRHAQNEIDDRLHDARPTGASRMAVVPFTCDHFSLPSQEAIPVSYTHLRAHETRHDLVCRLLL